MSYKRKRKETNLEELPKALLAGIKSPKLSMSKEE